MGLQQSKEELLYQKVSFGDVEGIKALRREGASLEWIVRDGKTPLIEACLNPGLYNVAKTLIELGANVNAYRPGRQAGTPLHHAAKRGYERTVKLLLSNGANPLILNDDCQTPLEVARAKGYEKVVRALESHICLFSGWMREFYGPGFLEVLAPQLVSRKVWVVVYPCGARKLKKPYKLELAIYSSMQEAQPHTVVALWKANLEEPKLPPSDPSVMIVENFTSKLITRGRGRRRNIYASHVGRRGCLTFRQTRLRLASANESDKQQLQWFCNACKGISQGMHPAFMNNNQTPTVPTTTQSAPEDVELAMALNASIQPDKLPSDAEDTELAMAIKASIQTAMHERPFPLNPLPVSESGPSTSRTSDPAPSAPPILDEILNDGPIEYPSIDIEPGESSSSTVENLAGKGGEKNEDRSSSLCVICLDAPIQGACVPCGHMAGCMSCLNEIKSKKWGCPVCRAKIEQVVKLYAI